MSSAAAPDASPTKATRQCDVLRKELSSLVSMAEGEAAGVEQVLDVEGPSGPICACLVLLCRQRRRRCGVRRGFRRGRAFTSRKRTLPTCGVVF